MKSEFKLAVHHLKKLTLCHILLMTERLGKNKFNSSILWKTIYICIYIILELSKIFLNVRQLILLEYGSAKYFWKWLISFLFLLVFPSSFLRINCKQFINCYVYCWNSWFYRYPLTHSSQDVKYYLKSILHIYVCVCVCVRVCVIEKS